MLTGALPTPEMPDPAMWQRSCPEEETDSIASPSPDWEPIRAKPRGFTPHCFGPYVHLELM